MTPERWQQLKAVLNAALERDPHERAAFISKACEGDESLRKELESLIVSHEQAGSFIEEPAVESLAEIITGKDESLVGRTLGCYQVQTLLGAGGMGEVYLAEDTRLGRRIALKLLPAHMSGDKDRLLRFQQEARAASALNHPNIVTIYEIATDGQHDFIAMEYVDGETLHGLISGGKLKTGRAVEIAAQAASALAAAHEVGIIHRDIKPENLMVTNTWRVKVLDFGLAKLIEGRRASLVASDAATAIYVQAAAKVKTTPGTILGTVAYMSPEQAEGRPLDRRTDIFSLGVVLYEMLAGKRPFEGKSAIDTLHSLINEEPRPVVELNPRLPLEVSDLLGKAMAKDPNERYQHAGDFELDLRRFKRALETNSLASAQMLRAAKTRALRSRSSLVWAVLGLLTLAVVSFASWRLGRSRAQPMRASSLEGVKLTPLTIDPGFEGEPTFAPDGQTIAYVSDRTGNFDIYLKQVSGGPDINLTNSSADDMQPAFSPDGKQIAFVSSRKGVSDCLCFFVYGTDQPLMGGDIWIMPALGGSARRIVESGTFPSWSPDGSSIIYTSGPWFGQRLYKVASDGGAAQEIPIKLKEAPPFVAYPTYSPDGRWIAFEASNNILTVRAEGGEPVSVVAGRHPAWTADSSAIIYSSVEAGKNYSLWQVPFSSAEGKVSGDAFPLTVGRGRDTQAAVSRDGKLIAYAALDVAFNIEIVPFNAETGKQTGPPEQITSGSDIIYFLSFSPDSRSVVFESHRGASSYIWKVERGSAPVQLTSDPRFEDSYPRWSPDGRTIAFNRTPTKGVQAPEGVWLMAEDGANPHLLIENGGLAGWIPDGRALAYSASDGQVHLYDLSTKSDRRITNEKGVASGGVSSPDGKWLTYQSIASGNVDIRAVFVDGGESQTVVATPRQDFHPTISPSGKWLYFQLDHKNLYRVPGPAQDWRQSAPEKVTNFPESGLFLEDPQISRDGHELLYSRRRTTGDIWIINLGK